MQEHLDSYIKTILDAHPTLGAVLDEAGIGCTACSLGTCRTRDILEIHNLDTEAARTLLTRMGEVIHQGRPFVVPALERKAQPARGGFCPPIARMVQEHTHIMKLIALAPALERALAERPEPAMALLAEALDFIRDYADRYHHAKEEDILFRFFDPEAEILGVMVQDHTQGRAHVAAMAAALAQGDAAGAGASLRAYGALLSGHILREDTILYPWMDRTLTTRQVGELFQRCGEAEARFGDAPQRYEAFVAGLADRIAALA